MRIQEAILFIEAKLIVSDMPSVQIDKLIQGETNDIDN